MLLAVVGYLGAWPVPVDPLAWDAPAPVDLRPTGKLTALSRVELRDGHGPEDVDVDPMGRVIAGVHDGRLLVWPTPGGEPTTLADTGGRPLGLDWLADGRLVVADAWRGLLAVDTDGNIETLTSTCGGRPLRFTDDVEVASDGTAWFSDATERFDQPDWKLDLVENRPSGRLCAWRAGMTDAREVLGGLHFANGVAVHGNTVLVVETARHQVRQVVVDDLTVVSQTVMMSNLPGYPDGISSGSDSLSWLAIASPRNRVMDRTGPHPGLRKVLMRLPDALHPKPERTARVMGITTAGRIVHDLFDPEGEQLAMVTSVQERDGTLYLGSLLDTAWAWMPLPKVQPPVGPKPPPPEP